MRILRKFKCGLLIILTAFLFLTGCRAHHAQHHSGIDVVASVDFYGETARAVLGHHGHVTSLINNSNLDPHDFNPTAYDAEAVSNANVVVDNGLGYDSWMSSLVRDAPHARQVQIGEQLLHKTTHDNPHVWYQSQTMPKLVKVLARQFSRQDPAHRAVFKRNARRYLKSLRPLSNELNRLKRHRRRSQVDVSEPVFNYSLREMGYRVHDPSYAKAVEDGSDPSPEAIRGVQNDLKRQRIAFFVQNSQASDAIVNNLVKLAHRHHVPVVKVTETMPNHVDYQTWLMREYQEVAKAQEGGRN